MKAAAAIIPYEKEEQMAVLEFCDIVHMPYFHVNNEMWTESRKQKQTAKDLGVKSGVPDLFVFIPIGRDRHSPQYKMVVIEMKRRKGSTTSKEQKEWATIFTAASVPHIIAKGASEAIKFLVECQAHYKIKPAKGIQPMSETEVLLTQFIREIIKPENAMQRQELIASFALTFDKSVESMVAKLVDSELAKAAA